MKRNEFVFVAKLAYERQRDLSSTMRLARCLVVALFPPDFPVKCRPLLSHSTKRPRPLIDRLPCLLVLSPPAVLCPLPPFVGVRQQQLAANSTARQQQQQQSAGKEAKVGQREAALNINGGHDHSSANQ